MIDDIREFLRKAEQIGQVSKIQGADWDLEIGRISEMAAYEYPESSALVFDNIKGYKHGYRVLTNFFNRESMIALACGLPTDLSRLGLVKSFRDKMKAGFKPVPPVAVDTGPILENIDSGDAVDLFKFPVPKWNKLDGGRYIGTGSVVINRDPDDGRINLGTYRVQAFDKNTAGIFTGPGKHGDIIRRKYWSRGLSCPTAVVCGPNPLLFCMASSPIPKGVSEYDYAGWLVNSPAEVVIGRVTGLPIPASAEIVIEGDWLPPEVESRAEGPFAEFTGYYASGSRDEAVLRVRSVMYRNNPILLGPPPYVGSKTAFQRFFSSAMLWIELDQRLPGICGVWQFGESGGPAFSAVALDQQFAGHAKQALMIASGYATAEPWRFIVAVDGDIDPSSISQVLWALGTRCDPETSIDILRGCRGTPLDTMLTPEMKKSKDYVHSRALINACRPYAWRSEFPATIRSSPEEISETRAKWGGSVVQRAVAR